MRALVLGGAGFIGRHVAAALRRRGHEVAIGTRHPRRTARRLPEALRGCERCEVRFERLHEPGAWHLVLAGFDIVVNAVGILRPRGGETYERVHHLAPAALARACALTGRRLVHVSALGLHPGARSRFILSKIAGEHAVASSGADYSIVRPSLLEGPGGFGARWLAALSRLPVHVVSADATGRIAVMRVEDLAKAIAVLCEVRNRDDRREVELGGGQLFTMAEYLANLRRRAGRGPATTLRVPPWLARLASHACDLLHFSPFSFGHFELMRRDNAPRVNLLPELVPAGRLTVLREPLQLVEAPPVALGRPAF